MLRNYHQHKGAKNPPALKEQYKIFLVDLNKVKENANICRKTFNVYYFPSLGLSTHYVNPVSATGFKGFTDLSSLT